MTTSDDTTGRTVLLDLVVVIGLVLLSSLLIYWSFDPLAPLRVVLGLASVLFAPGYVTSVAVVRSPDSAADASQFEWATSGLDRLEWVVLSVLTSVVVVSILGLLLGFTSLGITPTTMVFTVNGYTVSLAVVTLVRRWLFDEGRAGLPFDGITSWGDGFKNPPTRIDAVLDVVLVFLLVAGGVVVATPVYESSTPQFTEFSLLAETAPTDATANYLSSTGPNETERIRVGITNHEHRRVNYTVIVQVQRAAVAPQSVRVLDRRRISRFRVELDHNETSHIPYGFTVSEGESGCRVAFLLYTGDVPRSPTVENAYRELHLWHTVNPPPEGPSCPNLGVIDARVNRTAIAN